MEKTTIEKQFMAVRDFLEENGAPENMITFIDGRIEQVKNKNASRSTKPSKSAIETADVAEKILAILPASGKFTATEIANMDDSLKGTSNQRMTAALKVLVSTKLVENIREKGKSYFQRI